VTAGDLSPDDEMLAAELALGLLDGDERTAVAARTAAEPALAAAHARWLAYALTLSGVGAERPGPDLWERVRAQLPADASHGAMPQRWPAWAGAAAAFLLGWASGHGWERRPVVVAPAAAPARPPLVAMLTASNGTAVVAISFTPGGDRLVAVPRSVAPGGRVTELWVIPSGERPIALAVLPHAHASWQAVAPASRRHLLAGATLALSLEPAGGSPTGQPTGPVILTGTIAEPS
jgi:anti-sigma-K factor RskA